MRRLTLLLILTSLSFLIATAQEPVCQEVKIKTDSAAMVKLASLGLPLEEGYHSRDGYWTIVLPLPEVEMVKAEGIEVQVIRDNYRQYIEKRNMDQAGLIGYINSHKEEFNATDVSNYAIPTHFKLGSMGGFLTLAEVYSELDSMRLLFPERISARFTIGNTNSIEGRPLYAVRISNNPNQTQNKPRVFYNALTHAREPMGMQQMIFFMWYLLENYESSEEIQYLVDNLELYFVPVANPDGYEFNRTMAPIGGGDWRKNRRNNGDGTWGVDLNRNYGYKWGWDDLGSSPVPGELTYRGTGPFSEPETQAVRDFCIDKEFRIALNYHSYSNYLLYPWSWQNQLTPDSTLELTYADYLTRENGYLPGTPGGILYNTNGDSMDWEYGEQVAKPKIIPFTMETGNQNDGFWPQLNRIIPLAQENMYSNLMLAHFALRFIEIEDVSPAITQNREGYFKFEFRRLGMDAPANYQVSVEPLDTSLFLSTGATRIITYPVQFQTYSDSIAYSLREEIVAGTEISFIYRVSNGMYTFRDTVTKFFGPPLVVFSDSCNNMDNWSSAKWNLSATQYHTPPGSLTDSPTGNYTGNANNPMSTKEMIDLLNSPVAVINYWAKWKTEKGFDYVQVKVSDDNGITWTPLAGRYTVTGTEYQALGQPVYDGKRYAWVREQIILKEYLNKDIKLRFHMRSDAGMNFDGFYLDDVTVTVIDMTGVGLYENPQDRGTISDPVPNPAGSTVTITYNLETTVQNDQSAPSASAATFELMNIKGQLVGSSFLPSPRGIHAFSVDELKPGIYFYRINHPEGSTAVRKLVVIR